MQAIEVNKRAKTPINAKGNPLIASFPKEFISAFKNASLSKAVLILNDLSLRGAT